MSAARSQGFWLGLAPLTALLGLSLLGLSLLAGPVSAEKIGVAAAVNPDAFSSLNGGQRSEISIGKSIFFNERINTTGSGLVQVLLIDGSTFTVGPGSDLVIDKFVYDPKASTGELALSIGAGVFRFVVHKGVTISGPRAETDTHYMIMGIALDLDRATRNATWEVVDFLVKEKGLTPAKALSLASIAVDFRVSEVVDLTQVVTGYIPKNIFLQ